MNVAYYKFDVDDTTGELDSNRPVPFRQGIFLLHDSRIVGESSVTGTCNLMSYVFCSD
jgi:hypothetical protein